MDPSHFPIPLIQDIAFGILVIFSVGIITFDAAVRPDQLNKSMREKLVAPLETFARGCMMASMEDFLSSRERFHRKLLIIGAIAFVVIGAAVLIGVKILTRPPPPMSRYVVDDREEIVYSGNATPEDAKALAQRLKAIGFVTGDTRISIFLQKQSSQTFVSFIVSPVVLTTREPELERVFRGLGAGMKALYPDSALSVRLLDGKLQPLREYKIE